MDNNREEECVRLRCSAADYVDRFLQRRGIRVETTYLDRVVKMVYRPRADLWGDRCRSLTIATYWRDGFVVWIVWKGEDAEREDVHVKVEDDDLERTDFPELDHVLVEL
jgi:hypothetical protein